MDIDTDEPTEKHKKLVKNLEEFETYIRNNAGFIQIMGSDGVMVRPSPPRLWNRPLTMW
jgi:gamma-glutamyl:cysteine ligase YbdK (ATP-grasp superfamily)